MRMIIPVAICIGVGIVLNYFLTEINFLYFFIKVVTIIVVYLLSVCLIGYTKNDRKRAIDYIKRKKRD